MGVPRSTRRSDLCDHQYRSVRGYQNEGRNASEADIYEPVRFAASATGPTLGGTSATLGNVSESKRVGTGRSDVPEEH